MYTYADKGSFWSAKERHYFFFFLLRMKWKELKFQKEMKKKRAQSSIRKIEIWFKTILWMDADFLSSHWKKNQNFRESK